MKKKKIKNFLNIVIPYIFVIILCGLVWWSKDFFTKDSFMNNGDTVFKFFPKDALYTQLFKWDENMVDGLGRKQLFSISIHIDAFYSVLKSLKIPLWVLNRLWFVFPTFIFGCSLWSLFRRFSFYQKYRNISGFVAIGYVMVSPIFTISPVIYISFASFVYIFCISADILRRGTIKLSDIAKISVLSLFLPLAMRNLYYAPIFLFIYFCYYLIFVKKALQRQFIRRLGVLVLFLFLINMHIIAPAFFPRINQAVDLKMSSIDPFAYQTKAGKVEDFHRRRLFAPYNAFRLLSSVDNKQLSYSFNNGQGCFLSFIFPVISILLLLKRNIKRELFVLIIFTQTLFFFTVMTYFKGGFILYKFLSKFIPGFWIHDPSYILTLYAVFAGVLIGVFIQTILNWINSLPKKFPMKKYLGITFVCVLVYILVFTHGRNVIFDRYPFPGTMGNFMYGNHNPYFKVPSGYTELRNYLLNEAEAGDRILNLPIVREHYCIYTWYPYHNMPELISSYSPIPVAGNCPLVSPMFKQFLDLRLNKNLLPAFVTTMKLTGIRYVIVHKDYTCSGFFSQGMHSGYYLRLFSDSLNFEKNLDNGNFCLFRLKTQILAKSTI